MKSKKSIKQPQFSIWKFAAVVLFVTTIIFGGLLLKSQTLVGQLIHQLDASNDSIENYSNAASPLLLRTATPTQTPKDVMKR